MQPTAPAFEDTSPYLMQTTAQHKTLDDLSSPKLRSCDLKLIEARARRRPSNQIDTSLFRSRKEDSAVMTDIEERLVSANSRSARAEARHAGSRRRGSFEDHEKADRVDTRPGRLPAVPPRGALRIDQFITAANEAQARANVRSAPDRLEERIAAEKDTLVRERKFASAPTSFPSAGNGAEASSKSRIENVLALSLPKADKSAWPGQDLDDANYIRNRLWPQSFTSCSTFLSDDVQDVMDPDMSFPCAKESCHVKPKAPRERPVPSSILRAALEKRAFAQESKVQPAQEQQRTEICNSLPAEEADLELDPMPASALTSPLASFSPARRRFSSAPNPRKSTV